ncbi:MAG: 23S rRNA (adenine(2503)-C(2))-methyltransferase RlmN [Mariprofundaceae bacterium]|nr:23S rRNA (adenine(2503)-C(2))-methyltransferase RlmN [Mariprofundaceae bacterium]
MITEKMPLNGGEDIALKRQLPALSLAELNEEMAAIGQPVFRSKQVRDWLMKGITDPAQMRNIPAELRTQLENRLLCSPLKLAERQCSADGTRKYLFNLARGGSVETVLIPEASRATVCVSSQIGCVLDCPFCHTGTQSFSGNLTAGEIIAQVLAVKADLLNEPLNNPLPESLHQQVTHVVYMGMGEPLANETAVYQSLHRLMDTDGLKLSRRRITVSTSGLSAAIARLGASAPVNLAISLHAAIDTLRDELVPINRKYPLAELRAALNAYPLPVQRHITLEYVMLDGINDRNEDLAALARFVNPQRERINLIHFNAWPDSPYAGSSKQHMNNFAKQLIKKGIRATVRRSRGDDIMAACGQLKSQTDVLLRNTACNSENRRNRPHQDGASEVKDDNE